MSTFPAKMEPAEGFEKAAVPIFQEIGTQIVRAKKSEESDYSGIEREYYRHQVL